MKGQFKVPIDSVYRTTKSRRKALKPAFLLNLTNIGVGLHKNALEHNRLSKIQFVGDNKDGNKLNIVNQLSSSSRSYCRKSAFHFTARFSA